VQEALIQPYEERIAKLEETNKVFKGKMNKLIDKIEKRDADTDFVFKAPRERMGRHRDELDELYGRQDEDVESHNMLFARVNSMSDQLCRCNSGTMVSVRKSCFVSNFFIYSFNFYSPFRRRSLLFC
jgi:hypothetical protein